MFGCTYLHSGIKLLERLLNGCDSALDRRELALLVRGRQGKGRADEGEDEGLGQLHFDSLSRVIQLVL